ncbi:MAG: 50S ribosomal protein L25 [Candidatus Eisenbacteria sp.]|nr:50S ribosomal protein L25 [Candidatus Eisenbacteria bacterium]
MALVQLAGRTREEKGKGAAHRLRDGGYLPGVVYGPGGENVLIAIEARSFDGVLRQAAEGTVLIDLKLDQGPEEGLKVLIKEVQRDPATSRALHVDFLHISMDRPVQIEVAVRLTGIAEGVKNEGGFLDHVLRELEIECLPGEAPDYIEVDVTPLHLGQSLHAAEIQREGLKIITPPDRVVVAVHGRSAAAMEEEAAEEAAAAAAAGEDVEKPAEGEAAEPKGESTS